jgi:hypothetical protein
VPKDYFKGKSLCEITPLLVEKFKHERIKTPTKYGRARAEASVNREFEMLSRVFNLAIDFKKAETNPCSRVRRFKLDNEPYRYLLPEETIPVECDGREAGALATAGSRCAGPWLTET